MSDYIKREDAIEAIRRERDIRAIANLPSADAIERKRGEWITYKDEHRCSVCGEVVCDDWYCEDDVYSFCPACGALMVADRKE